MVAQLARNALMVFAQLTEQHCEDEGPRIVVGAIAFGKIRHAKNGVLKHSGGIGHAREMTRASPQQFPRLLIEGVFVARDFSTPSAAPSVLDNSKERMYICATLLQIMSRPMR